MSLHTPPDPRRGLVSRAAAGAEMTRDFIGYGAEPPHARWPGEARVAVNLVVHPLSCCGIWHDSDPGAARGAVAPSAAPDEGVLVLVPVRGGAPDGLFNLGPGLEAAALEGQRAQDLPPRLD